MKEFLINWIIGVVVILIVLFFITGIPFILSFIGLPDWINIIYLFMLCSIFLAITGMKN